MNKENLSVEELLKLAESSKNGELLNAVQGRLSEDKQKQLFSVLSDKEKTEKLLSSEKAQRLMKKFGQKN